MPRKPALEDRLLYFLQRSGLKRSELARRIGVRPSSVTGWLNGDARPRHANLVELARVLRVDLSEFFGPLERAQE